MKKLILLVAFLLMCSVSYAGILDTLEKVPGMKQGVAWSFADSEINYLSTVEVLAWKGVSLEAGYAGRAKNTGDKIVGVISYPLVKLKDLGVTVPILDLIELNVGAYAGMGRITGNNEIDYGVSATVINLHF